MLTVKQAVKMHNIGERKVTKRLIGCQLQHSLPKIGGVEALPNLRFRLGHVRNGVLLNVAHRLGPVHYGLNEADPVDFGGRAYLLVGGFRPYLFSLFGHCYPDLGIGLNPFLDVIGSQFVGFEIGRYVPVERFEDGLATAESLRR